MHPSLPSIEFRLPAVQKRPRVLRSDSLDAGALGRVAVQSRKDTGYTTRKNFLDRATELSLLSHCSREDGDCMHIQMKDLVDGSPDVLAGAINGRTVFSKLMQRTADEPGTPEPLFLDFSGVGVATASFLRETVLAFRDTVRRHRSNFYPVIANAGPLVEEELKVLVASHKDVLMVCVLEEDGHPHRAQILGDLDPKQKFTFDLVQQRGLTDATQLWREHGLNETVKTAWNNRLAALANLGLVVELSEGRTKRYRPLFAES